MGKKSEKRKAKKATTPSKPTSPVFEKVNAVNDVADSTAQELEIPSSTDEGSVPTSAAVTANEEPIAPNSPPPPPPPPPPPAVTPSPTLKGGVRMTRRQSTWSAPQTKNTSSHTRSATDPSSSTPNFPGTNSGSSNPRPSSPAAELASALKRNNTVGSFSPSSLKRTIAATSSGNTNIDANSNGGANGKAKANSSVNGNENGETNVKERRTSSPPPAIKPKPASLSMNRGQAQNQKRMVPERSASFLLKAALVQGASAAVNGKPASSTSAKGPDTSKVEREDQLERRMSVQSIARSLESSIQFSVLPSPGTPYTLRNRNSVASNKSLRSIRSAGREGEEETGDSTGNEKDEDGNAAEDHAIANKEDSKVEKDDEIKRERMSAVVAALANVRVIRSRSPTPTPTSDKEPATSMSTAVTSSAEEVTANIAVVTPSSSPSPSVSAVTAPSPPLTPPLSPPLANKTPTKVVSAPPAPPTPPQEPLDSPKTASTSPLVSKPPPVQPTVPKVEQEKNEPPAFPAPPEEELPVASSKSEETAASVVPSSTPSWSSASTSKPSKRFSVPPPSRLPPPPPVEAEPEADGGSNEIKDIAEQNPPEKTEEEDGIPSVSVRELTLDSYKASKPVPIPTSPPALKPKSAKRYSVPPPLRPPPPAPVEEGSGKEQEVKVQIPEEQEEEENEIERQAKATALTDVEDHDLDQDDRASESVAGAGVLGNVIVQEPDEIGTADGQVVQVSVGNTEYDSAEDDSSSDGERHESFKSALSRNESSSPPPTPPTKHETSFPINLISKWSRNTSAVPSANVSASTLALEEDQLQAHVQDQQVQDESNSDNEDGSLAEEGTTLAHVNPNDLSGPNDAKDSINEDTIKAEEEDPMDSRFKFPPVSAFPPPPPLPNKRNTGHNNNNRNMRVFGVPNESETSLASVLEVDDEESADEGDRDTIVQSNVLRLRKKSKAKTKLTSALAAALAKSASPPPFASGKQETETDEDVIMDHTESESSDSHSSTDGTDPVFRAARAARFAKIDAQENSLPRPAPFPTGDGQIQSAPEVPSTRRPIVPEEDRRRTVRLSSKLLPITGPQRMNTSPSTYSAWSKQGAVLSSETLHTIGTIATEPGDLDTSQFGSLSGAATAAAAPPTSFLGRMKSDVSRSGRPPMRRQTTSTSQASRFVEDLPIPLPFLKRSISPAPMSTTSTHQRTATVSFSSRVRRGSTGQATITGPSTRKNSLIPELRAATIEAAERPMSAVSGDFVLIQEPEEFDVPRAEWDLPRIPSGSLRMPSTMDLKIRAREDLNLTNINGSVAGRKAGPSSAPARNGPSVRVAPIMQHSRSATTGTSGTSGSSGTASTGKTSASAPAGPAPMSYQYSTGGDSTTSNSRLSSDALLDLWGRVGVYMSDAAALLHDKSRRVLVGDGTYPGFVLAVARQVPTACIPSRTARYPYGHLIYFQTAGTVHKRNAEILPGDVIVLQNALFKGVRGPLHQSYQEELGTKGDPVVGVIGEYEMKKCKARVYQANQHVGIQTVEYVSYRFNDLKSGTIKIFRVPDS